jgi:16S rRNA U516 pseudouridylate synthase RsuA-like enzyme
MFEAVNNKVLELKRIRVGKLHLDYLGKSLYKEVNLEDII